MNKEIQTSDENQTEEAGSAFSKNLLKKSLSRSIVIFLEGNLGAGKTTFTKGLMRGLGYNELVKSPTYNLVEIHETEKLKVFHFDLYRINEPHELTEIGIEEYLEKIGGEDLRRAKPHINGNSLLFSILNRGKKFYMYI